MRIKMHQISDLANVHIDDLVKASKQVQNRVRQDMQALNCSPGKFREQDDLPPIWDAVNLDPYVKKVVADYMESSPSTQRTIRPRFSSRIEPEMSEKRREFEMKEPRLDAPNFPRSQVKKIVGHLESYSTRVSQTKTSAATVIRQLEPTSTVRTQRNVNTKSKNDQKSKKPMRRELPLQRFAGSSLETIDFSKEHPNLELCTSQSTVFPRRFHKSLRNAPNRESVNLAAAKMREPKPTTPEIAIPILLKFLEQNERFHAESIKMKAALPAAQKTWKEVFRNNKSNEKTTTEAGKVSPKLSAVVDGKRGIDIICTPFKGLYHLEKEGALQSRQKMCSLQRLPVLYVRPECRVQRVAQISIHGNSCTDQGEGTLEKVPSNVGYVECRHEDGTTKHQGENSPRDQVSSPPTVTVVAKKASATTARSSNRFIDAIGSTEAFLSKSGVSCISLQSDRMSSTSTATTGTSAVEAVENTIQNNVKEIFNRTVQELTKPDRSQVPTSDVYVQTDFTKTPSESPTADPTPSSRIPSLALSEEFTSTMSTDERTSSSVGKTEQSQTQHNKTFSVDNESDVSNDVEKSTEAEPSGRRQRRKKKPLPRVELFLDDNNCEESYQLSSSQSEKRKTKQKSTRESVTREAPPNHLMGAEIKRAVKIFLSSLTPGNGDFYAGNVQHRLKPLRTANRVSVLNYDSSSSESEEEWEKSLFSMSSSSTKNHSERSRSDSLSEGEILSVGEV